MWRVVGCRNPDLLLGHGSSMVHKERLFKSHADSFDSGAEEGHFESHYLEDLVVVLTPGQHKVLEDWNVGGNLDDTEGDQG